MSKRIKAAKLEALKKRTDFKSRIFSQCVRCGRRRAYIRQFGICRICFREMSNQGLIPGVTKSSW